VDVPERRRFALELRPSDILIPVGVAILYAVAAKLGLALAFQARQVSVVWPPTGLAVAAVLLYGRRAVPGVLLGAFVANSTADEPLWVAAGIAVGNTLEAVAATALLARFGFDSHLSRLRDVTALIVAVAAAPFLSATIGVAFLGAGGVQPAGSLPELWGTWWLGDALGGLVFAPLLLVWTTGHTALRRRFAAVEGIVLLALLFGGCLIAFSELPPAPVTEYIVFPFLIWGAFRFGPIGTVTVTTAVELFAVWSTHAGLGPFADAGPEHGFVLLQVFMAVVATAGLILGAVVAQQRRAHEELKSRAEQMTETDRRKDEFLAMLAHELRNPLAPIVHAVELLGRGDPALAERAREIIERQSDHLTRLVDDLLDVSRITRGALQLDVRRIALGDAIAPAIETWRHVIGERRQELSIELPDRALWIDADPTRFAQAVSNLLHNAANFTPVGGRISIAAAEENGLVVLRVRDTGAGMAPEVLRTVFDLFVQGPPPPGERSSGLGLGLTLVRRLVELHGGTVEATSEGLGHGSEFTLRVPFAPAAKSATPSDRIPARGSRTAAIDEGRRVLVVDDNEDAREALRFLLEDEGHRVRTAGDGPDALREAEAFRPEIVLLDIGLPGMDGYEVARRLRTQPGSRDARIVAVSGYGQAEDRERSRAAGFDDHLLKPVPPARLLDLVKKSA
jgi:signal transduction histidine kinase/CheY-like chemotaxis protein